ncbi:sulfate/molybdate ABC transporter ATP-binding protein [Rathayibacter iranicus]|uniref:ABC transporter ATP-binding protein n=2 Tax=Rathayibacter iranicus TaxID=59737 RepID=A0AAD1ADW1_9MICO|nr:ABC transporter ATP-binding protein [Rathayibacter iranicus]AZZ56403.1 ABC transporter ATP-binding protein [Rathayibacter iranicus]MWV31777.1 ATP-binding cassette domain-containing protein [Rathayibacter iranicus NCPPB 2253 = VKM Ac-1602]PPI44850.1 molybdenum ABC transporter ATP-binding protein [Rathayibacter iranicus]PPI59084.1 molybdenum ABC transporter ATP-binding protein [Rathayibacter iranicus]PPI70301.1 molybdenum ABC transporter ATP-binding protein [Rathayibacter iranicus]
MSLRLDARLAARGFAASVDVAAGETVVVLGPNGAGKSTLLALIAGLVRADSGTALLDDALLFDDRRWTPPHRRAVALLAQDPLLFPHLSARENVAFGPRSTGLGRASARARAERELAAVDALELADRRPSSLSGGQAQRVALARALAGEPRLMLLDEPLAAIDARDAPVLRQMLRTVLAERSAIVVTHDVLDAWTLADRVVVLREGRVVEEGRTERVLTRPRTEFTAELAGLNLLAGRRTAHGLRTNEGHEFAGVATEPMTPGTPVLAAVRPWAVGLGDGGLRSIITDIEPRGDTVRVRSASLRADVDPARAAALDLAPGREIGFAVDPEALLIYPT